MYYYDAFGCHIQSDLNIPEFIPVANANVSDEVVSIRRADQPILVAASDHTTYFGCANEFLIDIANTAQFKVSTGKSIYYWPYPQTNEDEMRVYILGTCMGALLQQRGLIVLHGNAISLDHRKGSLFLGERGAGKSTTAAYYFRQGAKILADDVCAVSFDEQGQPQIIPSYPQIKLWQNSADLLGIDTRNLRRVRPQDEKFGLPIKHQFARKALPIDQIIEINHEEVNCVRGGAKLDILIRHSYRYKFLSLMGLTECYLKKLMQLASKVKILKQQRIPQEFFTELKF